MARLLTIALAILAISASTPTQVQPNLVDEARSAGKWLRSTAIDVGAAKAWPVTPGAPQAGPDATLYSGTPGVVLFFLELHNATRDAGDLAMARAGADWLITRIDGEPSAGLYTGLGGIGFTLTEVWKVTKDAKYRDAANRVVDRVKALAKTSGNGVEWSPVSDIISGTSGTGLFLLYAARELNRPDARDLAAAAGRRLVAQQMSAEGGAKWAMTPATPTRLYPNFSHGTAGVAYFLATLHKDTKDRTFLDAAMSGANYLLKVAKTDGDVCLVFHHEPEADGLDLFYLGWCHGPAGTARLYQRLGEITGDARWHDWVRRAARGISTSGVPEKQTPGFWNNVGQCCGSSGVGAFFLAIHRSTGDRDALSYARRVTNELLTRATRDAQGTRWTHAEHRVQPANLTAQTGWMQGAAGIGAWLLELDGFDRGRARVVTFPDSPYGAR